MEIVASGFGAEAPQWAEESLFDMHRVEHLMKQSLILRNPWATKECREFVVVVRYAPIDEDRDLFGRVKRAVRCGTHRLSSHVMVYNKASSCLVGNRPSGHATFDKHDEHATILERLDREATAGGGGRS